MEIPQIPGMVDVTPQTQSTEQQGEQQAPPATQQGDRPLEWDESIPADGRNASQPEQAVKDESTATMTDGGEQEAEPEPPQIHRDMLPDVIKDVVEDMGKLRKIEDGLVLAQCLPVIATSLSKGLRVEGRNFITYSNVFSLVAGRSRSGKGASYKYLHKPVSDIQKKLTDELNERLDNLKADKGRLEKQLKKAQDSDDAEQARTLQRKLTDVEKSMLARRVYTEDFTVQSLAVGLVNNDEKLSVFSAEAGDALNNLAGRYNDRNNDDALIKKLFSNEGLDQLRISRDCVRLDEPVGSMLLMTTPDEIRKTFSNEGFVHGGFLNRCFCMLSQAEPKPRGKCKPNQATWDSWSRLIDSLWRTYGDCEDTKTISMTDEAVDVIDDYEIESIDRGKQGSDILLNFLACEAEKATKVAVCLHAAKYGTMAANHPLGADEAQAAVMICRYFSEHFERLIQAAVEEQQANDKTKLIDRISKKMDSNRVTYEGYDWLPIQVLTRSCKLDLRWIEHVLDQNPEAFGTTEMSTAGKPKKLIRAI